MCSRSTPIAFSPLKGGQFKGKKKNKHVQCSHQVLSTKHFTLQIFLCWASLPTNTDRAYQGMIAGPKDKTYNPTCLYTAKLSFLQQRVYLILTNYWEKFLAYARTLPHKLCQVFSVRVLVLTHLSCVMEYNKSDMIWMTVCQCSTPSPGPPEALEPHYDARGDKVLP